MFGYAGKMLHVDLGKERIWTEPLPQDKIKNFLGGRGINASLLWDLVEPGIDPFGEKNVLIFGTGTLTGTFAPSSGRTTITCKGPATNLYLRSSVGLHWGPELKFAGYDHLIIHGRAKRPVYLYVKDEAVEIRDASKFWGKDVERTEALFREELSDERFELACIGPGGENRVMFASIMMGHNAAGRGGAGALMGSKGLKGIAVQGNLPIKVANPDGFLRSVSESIKALEEFSGREGLRLYGTAQLVLLRNERHLFPTKNFQESYLEDAYQISGQYLRERGYLTNRFGCSTCGTSCHRYTEVKDGKYEGAHSGGPEYETVGALGAGCGVTDTEAVLKASELCNRYGLDTISTGSAIQWAMECYEKEIITDKDTGDLKLTWGNGDAVVELVRRIARREGIGDLLAEGVKRAAEKVGKESWKWAIQVKGLEMSRAEIRARKGYALALAVNPKGPDHLHSQVYAEDGSSPEARALIKKICGSEKYATHVLPDKRGAIVRWHEDCYAATDCLGLCTFITLGGGYLVTPAIMAEMYSYATGIEIDEEELMRSGKRIMNIEKAFNVREGATRKDDTIPWRLMNEPIRSGPSKGMITSREELDQMLDEYYSLHEWDNKTGCPSREILEKLDIGDVADQLEQLGKISPR